MNQSIRTKEASCSASKRGVMAADQTMGHVLPVGDKAYVDSATLKVSAPSETQHNYFDAMTSDSDIEIELNDFLVHQDASKLKNAHSFYPPYSACCITLLPLYLHIHHPPPLISPTLHMCNLIHIYEYTIKIGVLEICCYRHTLQNHQFSRHFTFWGYKPLFLT